MLQGICARHSKASPHMDANTLRQLIDHVGAEIRAGRERLLSSKRYTQDLDCSLTPEAISRQQGCRMSTRSGLGPTNGLRSPCSGLVCAQLQKYQGPVDDPLSNHEQICFWIQAILSELSASRASIEAAIFTNILHPGRLVPNTQPTPNDRIFASY